MTQATTEAATSAVTFSKFDVDAARSAGATAERARVTTILGHERTSANMATAVQCINSGLSAEQAGAILGSLPATVAASRDTGFAAAMNAVTNPAVSGIESTDVSATADASALAAKIVDDFMKSVK